MGNGKCFGRILGTYFPSNRHYGAHEGGNSGHSRELKGALYNAVTCPKTIWVVVSNIFYFHPYLGKIPILTHIFQMG